MGRFVEGLLDFAARRWPDGAELNRAWRAELASLPPAGTRWRRLSFAGSLAVASALPAGSGGRVAGAGAFVAGIALLAGAGFNAVHLVGHAAGGPAAEVVAVLVAGGMAWLGRAGAGFIAARGRVVLAIGVAVGSFLLAGNRVAVMPYMGWMDIVPAVAGWTLLLLAAVSGVSRLVGGGQRRLAFGLAAVGGFVATDVAAVLGSLHAAASLRISAGSAPLWLPLALLPGGTVRFGAFHADGTGRFGGHLVSGPAFHASDVLLGNVSAMVGPLLLCSFFVAALATAPVRSTATVPPPGDRRSAALASASVVAVLLAPPAVGVRGAELAALVWMAAGAAAVAAARTGARATPWGPRAVGFIVLAPAGAALLWPGVLGALPVRAVLAVAALAVAGGAVPSRALAPWLALAGGAALVAMSVDSAMRRPGAVAASVARIEHNTAEFGFGFVANPGGAALLVALVCVAVSRLRVGGPVRAA